MQNAKAEGKNAYVSATRNADLRQLVVGEFQQSMGKVRQRLYQKWMSYFSDNPQSQSALRLRAMKCPEYADEKRAWSQMAM